MLYQSYAIFCHLDNEPQSLVSSPQLFFWIYVNLSKNLAPLKYGVTYLDNFVARTIFENKQEKAGFTNYQLSG